MIAIAICQKRRHRPPYSIIFGFRNSLQPSQHKLLDNWRKNSGKHLSGSGEKWQRRRTKRGGGSYAKAQDWEIGLGKTLNQLIFSFIFRKTLSLFQLSSFSQEASFEFFFLTYEFSRELRLFLQFFCLQVYYREGQNKHFLKQFLKLVGSTFNIHIEGQ